jgi:four helix bundle protein
VERSAARNFKELIVWQKALQFVLEAYKFSKGFPKSELFGLTSQLRRAGISIPANIAEGFKRSGPKDKARFMNISQGSVEECRYYLILANDLGYGNSKSLEDQLDEISRILDSYMKRILEKEDRRQETE